MYVTQSYCAAPDFKDFCNLQITPQKFPYGILSRRHSATKSWNNIETQKSVTIKLETLASGNIGEFGESWSNRQT